MSATNDGGPAFPDGGYPSRKGMSLRDWFAGQALAGQIANPNWPNVGPGGLPAKEEDCAAHWAYQFADAMIAEREKPVEPIDE